MQLNSILLLGIIYSTFTLVYSLQLAPTFRTAKNIGFVVPLPGSSHITYLLPSLNELYLRGHNITLISTEENQKYLNNYNGINFYSLGKSTIHADKMMSPTSSHPDLIKILPVLIKHSTSRWETEYNTFLNFIKESNVDLMICDHFSTSCFDAAATAKIPSVMSATTLTTSDGSASYINNDLTTMDDFTTQYQSIQKRFYNKFIAPIQLLFSIKDDLAILAEQKRKSGLVDAKTLEDPESNIKHSLKLIGNSFGLEAARPVGPLVEFVGLGVSETYPNFDSNMGNFLNSHKKVVYVAFGQHAMPIIDDVTYILTSLIIQWEKGHIDGIIWSSKVASKKRFPEIITSPYTGKSYAMAPLFDINRDQTNYDTNAKNYVHDIYVANWSSQVAILLHSSVEVFITHGGANSLMEGLYCGKRLIVYPFFGDQGGNAKQLTRAGVAETFDHNTKQETRNQLVEKIILDKDGSYQENTKKFQALVQIRSKNAHIKAADVIEEVLFTSTGQLLKHREDVGRSLSFIKRNNLDLYGIVLVIAVSFLSILVFNLKKLGCYAYNYTKIQKKLKTN
ncbi:hypothetical protein BJ944DRAFT_93518 [Cunninghamella echinulata]|nr:hypothetical protein BJ944DRAFT_93518 [Cunninghamella echinulata]